jgi:C-methyltransferase
MQMLIGTRGRERTEGEWRALFEQNGYALRETVSLRTFARLLVIDIE